MDLLETIQNEVQQRIDSYILISERHSKLIQYSAVAAGLTGVTLALRRVRPFKKIRRPNDCPRYFLEQHTPLQGHVVGVKPSGHLLVDHYPLVSLGRKSNPVAIALEGIEPGSLSPIWLTHVALNKDVQFLPIKVRPDALTCIVKEKQDTNLAEGLVGIGFASLAAWDKSLARDATYKKLYNELNQAQKIAQSKRYGMWLEKSSRSSLLGRLADRTLRVLRQRLQSVRLLPIRTTST